MAIKQNKPFVVGLTGGIGSGKSIVANAFSDLGACIVDADVIAHELTRVNQPAYQQIIQHFGDSILNSDQTLNRRALRNIIFSDPNEKKWLENLLHPLIRQIMESHIQQCTSPYCICVIPLLAESQGVSFLNRVLVVETPLDAQRQRAAQRDNADEQSIETIMNAQASQAKRRAIADDILINNKTITVLKEKILPLHQLYLQLAKNE